MAVEQSLNYCLSESKMIVWNIYGKPLGSNVQTVQLPSLHSHFYYGTIFFWNACIKSYVGMKFVANSYLYLGVKYCHTIFILW